MTVTSGTFSGGAPPLTVTDDIEVSADGVGGWSFIADGYQEFELTASSYGKYFRVKSSCSDAANQTLTSVSNVIGPITAPAFMVTENPVVTGDPCVGYTLSCSEPTVSGGIGPFQFSYFWVDEAVAVVDSGAVKMAPTTIVTDYDLGKRMKALVTVTDTGVNGSDPVTVESNRTQQVFRPTIDEYETFIEGELWPDSEAMYAAEPDQSLVFEARPAGEANFPPKDLIYSWEIRQGSGRLSGSTNQRTVIYNAPNDYPDGAWIQCRVQSVNANDAAFAAEIRIVTTGEP